MLIIGRTSLTRSIRQVRRIKFSLSMRLLSRKRHWSRISKRNLNFLKKLTRCIRSKQMQKRNTWLLWHWVAKRSNRLLGKKMKWRSRKAKGQWVRGSMKERNKGKTRKIGLRRCKNWEEVGLIRGTKIRRRRMLSFGQNLQLFQSWVVMIYNCRGRVWTLQSWR